MKRMKSKGTYKKGLGLKQVILEAKKSWHKGGADMGMESASDDEKAMAPTLPTPADDSAMGGRRRRGTRKMRRRSRR